MNIQQAAVWGEIKKLLEEHHDIIEGINKEYTLAMENLLETLNPDKMLEEEKAEAKYRQEHIDSMTEGEQTELSNKDVS